MSCNQHPTNILFWNVLWNKLGEKTSEFIQNDVVLVWNQSASVLDWLPAVLWWTQFSKSLMGTNGNSCNQSLMGYILLIYTYIYIILYVYILYILHICTHWWEQLSMVSLKYLPKIVTKKHRQERLLELLEAVTGKDGWWLDHDWMIFPFSSHRIHVCYIW